jgi:hypothetical protein
MLFCRKEEEKRILMKEDARDPRGLSAILEARDSSCTSMILELSWERISLTR